MTKEKGPIMSRFIRETNPIRPSELSRRVPRGFRWVLRQQGCRLIAVPVVVMPVALSRSRYVGALTLLKRRRSFWGSGDKFGFDAFLAMGKCGGRISAILFTRQEFPRVGLPREIEHNGQKLFFSGANHGPESSQSNAVGGRNWKLNEPRMNGQSDAILIKALRVVLKASNGIGEM